MIRHGRARFGSLFVAVLVVAATTLSATTMVSAASGALPEFEVREGVTTFDLISTTKNKIVTVGGKVLECDSGSGSGSVNGIKETDEVRLVMLRLLGCEYNTEPCKSAAEFAPGEIFTRYSNGLLGYINQPAKEVGLQLRGETGILLEAGCGAGRGQETVKVKGAFTGKIEPLNKFLKSTEHFALKFAQAAGIQTPKNFLCPHMEQLMVSINGGAYQEAGFEATYELIPVAKGEIKIIA